jgi:hypothetical protein
MLFPVLAFFPALILVSCACEDHSHTKVITGQSILEDERRQAAELRAENNGPEIAPRDYKRMMLCLASKREREQKELAQYAQFQLNQKIALAQASSPKLLITSSDIPSNYRQVDFSRSSRGTSSFAGVARSGVSYPARFYKRQIQEDSATQAEAALTQQQQLQQQQQTDPDAPYGVPVPGRPGFVTMPPKMGGYIDVRGYAPGSFVMDPWTRTIIRVP